MKLIITYLSVRGMGPYENVCAAREWMEPSADINISSIRHFGFRSKAYPKKFIMPSAILSIEEEDK